MILCLWDRDWTREEREELAGRVLADAPRVALGGEVIWVDARGLDVVGLAGRLGELGVQVGAGALPIVAELAARTARPAEPHLISADHESAFLSSCPLDLLQMEERWRLLLTGVGIETGGELGALEREAVEVRFGPELVEFWQRARGQDERRLFRPVPAEPPHAAIDFIDYTVTDPERLIFSVNSLLGGICADLSGRALQARRVKLQLTLANNQKWERMLRPARPTGSRTVWLRLARALLERITVSAAVSGIALVVDGLESASAVQGDLFDAGFATAPAVTAALERLIEAQGEVLAELDPSVHPLVEQRSRWKQRTVLEYERAAQNGESSELKAQDTVAPGLTLQLLSEPREVLVETVRRRDHQAPVRYRDGQWKQLLTAAGPDRISGGRWEEPYAREYFRVVTVTGTLVWLYRDAREDRWFLHGWWE
jgi:hypothetical protein